MNLRTTGPLLPMLLLVIGGCGLRHHHDRILIPAGYVGWIHIRYGMPGAPALQAENGYREIRIPASGRLTTSSPQEFGWVSNEFYYVSGASRQRLRSTGARGDGSQVWDRCTSSRGGGNPGTTDVSCFIGTEAQFNQFGAKTAAGPARRVE